MLRFGEIMEEKRLWKMEYDELHAAWVEEHLNKRRGERRGRLARGHGHSDRLFAKNVWYKLKGDFKHLHPEFEVLDWRGRSYFADFGYLPGDYLRLLIEIKDFGSHVRDKDRQGHSRECCREAFLTAMGYVVISFSYDDVRERPDLCIMLLRMVLSQYESGHMTGEVPKMTITEKEVIRLAFATAQHIRPIDVVRHLLIDHRTAVRLLQSLCGKGWFHPITREGGSRVIKYKLIKQHWRE